MANKYYKDAWKAMQKVKPSSSSSATTAKSYPKQQSDRLSAQLLVNGVENPLEKDSRNPLEKALNLTPDQNFIFDTFEVLGRPQQALFGAVDEGMRTGDWLGGAWKGLSGQKDTSGGQILRGFGIGDDSKGQANLLDPSTWGVDDVLGLGLDIFLDPADWALIPVTGGTSLLAEGASDAAKIASKADDVADAVKLMSKADDVAKIASKADDVADVAKIASKADNLFSNVPTTFQKYMPDIYEYKATPIMKDNLLGGPANAIAKITPEVFDAELAPKLLSGTPSLTTKADDVLGFTNPSNLLDTGYSPNALAPRQTSVPDIFEYQTTPINETNLLGGPKGAVTKVQPEVFDAELNETLARLSGDSNASKAMLGTKEVNDFAEAIAKETGAKVEDIKEALPKVSEVAEEGNDLRFVSLNDLLFGLAGKGLKKGIKLTDKAIGEALKIVDMSNGFEYAGDALKNVDNIKFNNQPLFELYKGAKKGISSTFNAGANKLNQSIRDILASRSGVSSEANEVVMARYNNLKNQIDDIYPRLAKEFSNDPELSKFFKDKDSFNKFLDEAVESIKQGNINRTKPINNISELAYKIGDDSSIITNTPEVKKYLDNMVAFLEKEMDEVNQARVIVNNIKSNPDMAFYNFFKAQDGTTNPDDLRELFNDMYRKARRKADSQLDFADITNTIKEALDKDNIILDKSSLDQLERASKYFDRKFASDNLTEIKKSMMLADDSDVMRAFSIIKEKYPEFANTVENIYKDINNDIDEIIKRNIGEGKGVKRVIDDFIGYDEAGNRLGDYESYARTQVNSDVLKILDKPEDFRKIFRNRQDRFLDTATINRTFAKLSKDDLKQIFPSLSEENIGRLQKVLQEQGLYRNDLLTNVFDVASTLPKRVSEQGIRTEVLAGLGYDNMLKQTEQLNKINDLTTKLKDGTLDNASPAELDAIKNNIAKARGELEKLQDGAIFRPISNIKYENATGKIASVKEIEDALNVKDWLDDSRGMDKSLKDVVRQLRGMADKDGKVLVNPMVYNMLNLNKDAKKSAGLFLTLVDKVTNIFKRNKLLSPGYNIRNITGNMFNMYVAGVPLNDMPGLLTDSIKTYTEGNEAIARMAKGELFETLPDNLKKAYGELNELRRYGFGDTSKTALEIAGMDDIAERIGKSSNPLTKGIDAVNQANLNINMQVDNISRLAMMKYANNNPSYLKKMGFDNAGEAIAYSLFDPSNMSDMEKNVFKKVVPFYTFTKKNLAFQFKNLGKNATRYKRVLKAIDSAWGDEENIADYNRNNLAIPLWENEDGSRTTFNANLPFSDLLEWFDNPAQKLASSVAPFVKIPFELTTNQEMFTGQPISRFEGEQSDLLNRLPGANTLPSDIDNSMTDYLLSQLGVDVPLKTALNVFDIGGSILGLNDKSLEQSALDALGVFGTNDPSKVQLSKEFDELQKLQDYVDYLEQEGVHLQTVTEFENTNKGRINSELQAQIDALLGRTTTSTSNNDAIAWTTKK